MEGCGGRQEQHRRTHWGGCASFWNAHLLESQSTDRLEGISLKSSSVAISKSQQPVLEPERSQRAVQKGHIAGLDTERREVLSDSCRDGETLPVGELPNEKA